MVEWYESLPEKCPPKDAFVPENGTYFRLGKGEIPSDIDFFSIKKEGKKIHCDSITECIARSVSIWANFDDCFDIKKLPGHKKLNEPVLKIILKPEDGMLLKTFKKSHYSWWRSRTFVPKSAVIVNGNE